MDLAQEQIRSVIENEAPRHENASDYVAAVVLGLAAAATAWCAYEAELWNSTQTIEAQQWTYKALKASELQLQGNQRYQLDAVQFGAYLTAKANHHERLAEFIHGSLSSSAKPAVDAWLATHPFESAQPGPQGPLVMPEYRISDWGEADRLHRDSVVHLNKSLRANAIADDYMFGVVLLAAVSLFCGSVPKLGTRRVRRTLVAVSAVLLASSLVWAFTRPIELRRAAPTIAL